MSEKFMNFMRALFSCNYDRLWACDELSGSFETTDVVRQECPILPFSMNFIIDEIMDDALGTLRVLGIKVPNGEKLRGLTYANDLVCGSWLMKDGNIVLEASVRISKIRAAYAGLKYLRPDVSLKLNGCVLCRSMLHWDTWFLQEPTD